MPFRIRLAWILTSRWAFVVYNSGLFLVGAAIAYSMLLALLPDDVSQPELEDLSSGIGVILVGYGVIAESIETLKKIFGVYPIYHSALGERIDVIHEHYGLLLLVLGLLIEIPAEIVKLPNDTLEIGGAEPYLFAAGFIFSIVSLLLLVQYSITLILARAAGEGDNQVQAH
jgi:hypothetical protein